MCSCVSGRQANPGSGRSRLPGSHSRSGKANWSTISNRNGCRWPACSGSSRERTALARIRNAIVFPKGPAHAGVFRPCRASDVTVKFRSGTHTQTLTGKPVTSAELQPDTSGNPTVVEMGSLRLQVIVRGQRVGIRLKDLDSEAVRRITTAGHFFPVRLVVSRDRNLAAVRWQDRR